MRLCLNQAMGEGNAVRKQRPTLRLVSALLSIKVVSGMTRQKQQSCHLR